MSSRFGFAGGLPERKVRPIWDAIDSRQFKNALKLCSTLLTKHPNSPYALALKALVLERMGKASEALSVCLSAKEFLHTNDALLIDELTLSTLQIVFQRLDHLDMATSCYDYACGKFPNNLELMMGLFNCYVREYSFVKQQQIAIKMYKLAGEERFLLWAVCSIQLQVHYSPGGEKLLLLAEGLLKKHIASHSLHEPEALIVYISLLEQQAKFGDALEVISGKLGSLIMIEVDRLRLQGKLLAKAGDYAGAADVFQKVLELCADDWDCFLNFLGCLLEDGHNCWEGASNGAVGSSQPIECNNMQLAEEVFEMRVSAASTLMEKLMTEASGSLRCPYLGNLEIERRKLLYGKGDLNKLVEGLMQYFLRFGHLACFTSDIEMHLQVLNDEKKNEFLKKIMKECESATNLPKIALGQSITLFKVQNLISDMFNLPIKELEEIAARMTHTFCANLHLSKDIDPQENMLGEELLSMSCNVLVQLFWRTKNLGYLLESIMILEFGLAIRRHVWQYKVLLLHLYSHWGSLPLAYERYKSLDVKNILLETVSHHIFPQMLTSPLWADLDLLLSDYLRFMDDHFRESADLTFLAYRHRNYSKVIEFVQFKEKLQRSNQYLMAKVESPILQLKQKSNNIEEEERILESLECGVQIIDLSRESISKSLTFNEDLQFRPWWTPTYEQNYLLGPFDGASYRPKENLHNQLKEAEASALKTIEKRSLLPRMIYLSIHCASSSVKEYIEGNGALIDPKVPLELKVLLERYAQILGYPFKDAIELVFSVSSGQKSSEVLSSNFIDWMNFVIFLNAWNLNTREVRHPVEDKLQHSTWPLVHSLLKKVILEKVGSIGALTSSPGSDFSVLVQLITEPLAWHTIIIQSCAKSLLPSGKKKKKGSAPEQSSSKLIQEIRDSVHCICDILDEVAKWSKEQINKSSDEKFDYVFSSIQNEGRIEGPGKVFQIVQDLVSSVPDAELGDRITQAVQSWSPHDVARRLITSQDTMLSEFLKICDSKSQSLRSLKVHL